MYLSNDMYEELTVQNESRRILTEEQGAKLTPSRPTSATSSKNSSHQNQLPRPPKRPRRHPRLPLHHPIPHLDTTETILTTTKHYLAQSPHPQGPQSTEARLATLGTALLGTLSRTVGDVDGLHEERAADRPARPQPRRVGHRTGGRRGRHGTGRGADRVVPAGGREAHIAGVAERMHAFVRAEREQAAAARALLDESLAGFVEGGTQLQLQQERAREEMEGVLDEIKVVRDAVKERVGESLQAIAGAAEKIAGEVLSELGVFHGALHASYRELGRECKEVFEELGRQMRAQRAEAERLRGELEVATRAVVEANEGVAERVREAVEEGRRARAERAAMVVEIGKLVAAQGEGGGRG